MIREELPDTAIIVLSAHVEVNEAMDLLTGGEHPALSVRLSPGYRPWLA